MILHILEDSHFAEYAIQQFSKPEMDSEFVVFAYGGKLKHIKSVGKVKLLHLNQSNIQLIIKNLFQYRAVIFHGLFCSWMEPILKAVPDELKVAWVFWGGEIYGRKDLQERFLSGLSKRLFRLHRLKQQLFEKNVRYGDYEMPIICFRRVDYCLCDVAEEESFLQEYIGKELNIRWYNYYSIEETIGLELMQKVCNGTNVLVGNSSSIECNHLESLICLRKVEFDQGKVIVPLSYGEAWLRNFVCKIGHLLFGERYGALTDYMPREEYNQVIASCSVVIMNHWRQQAFGNIMTALWLGSRVYMSKRSPLYAYFKRLGCILYSVEDDLTREKVNWNPLTDAEREQNRKAISAEYNKETMHMRNLELVRELNA